MRLLSAFVITLLLSVNLLAQPLPRSTPEAENFDPKAVEAYLQAVKDSKQELHSLMILRNGKVISEQWFGQNGPDVNHVMWSVSKTFTATAIGFAVKEKKLKLTDKVISFFPEAKPDTVSENLAALEIRHLLTMSVGHASDPTDGIRQTKLPWEKYFLSFPMTYKPGEKFIYNSIATYMLSAILQKVTGEKLIDYLTPRFFEPLGIKGATWESSPSNVTVGGWGLYVKTEDMAKMGQFLLQKGRWNGKRLLPKKWIKQASKAQIHQPAQWVPADANKAESDWAQGYGYQLWRCRNNAFRADGLNGQFIIVLPEKNAVIVTTAYIPNMQEEINLIWKHLYPALK